MTDRFSLVKFDSCNALQPKPRETLFCKTLVIGNSIAACVATLAILQAGEQVCWVQHNGAEEASSVLSGGQDLAARSRFSWRWGRRITPWETAYIMSQTQASYWANRPLDRPLPLAFPAAREEQSSLFSPLESTAEETFQQAIAPYLHSRQLLLIPRGKPRRILYAEQRGKRRVFQVVFEDVTLQSTFTVHARLTLDATPQGDLQRLLENTAAAPIRREWIFTPEQLALDTPRQGRGPFFEDAIALLVGPSSETAGIVRPLSVPLRAMVLEQTDGLLCILPSTDAPHLLPWLTHRRTQWTLGEAMGHVAVRVAKAGGLQQLREHPHWQWYLQQKLVQQGIPLFAFDDVPLTDPDFEAIQMMAIANVVRTMRDRDLSFRPETPVTRAVLASALMRLSLQHGLEPSAADSSQLPAATLPPTHWAKEAMEWAIAHNFLALTASGEFAPSQVISQQELRAAAQSLSPLPVHSENADTDLASPARRRHLSRTLYALLSAHLQLHSPSLG